MIEITKKDEPKLFKFIEEIVSEVKTDFPKKVYLSADVNACVFYDSSFWSMFFPIRKNLQIGIGLVNTISEQEFKAILAHEFGHFSQRSMKVGSYVHNVNNVIFNMLFDNESYGNMIQSWADISGYFSIFVAFAVKIIQAIQWVLRKMYAIVNISYMALSREMEFHADEIAANVAGYLPLKESLLRMNLADHSYNAVLNFYNNKITDNIKSSNIYQEQTFVMNFLAVESNLTIKNNLPVVSQLDLKKYNKSKLNIKDQWASHPSNEERITALEKTSIQKEENKQEPAILLFSNSAQIQEKITEKVFSNVVYGAKPEALAYDKFKENFVQKFNKSRFPKAYNGYYDDKNPVDFDMKTSTDLNEIEDFDTLFSKEKVDMIYDYAALDDDKNVLTAIASKIYQIKTFDYDGQKFNQKDAKELAQKLEKELINLKENITKNDLNIYKFFHNKALQNGEADVLENKYLLIFKLESEYENKLELYNKLEKSLNFTNEVTPFDQIKNNFSAVLRLEIELETELKSMLADEVLKSEVSKEMIDNITHYLSKDWTYFNNEAYELDNLEVLFTAVNTYKELLSVKYFITKVDLLNYQIELFEK